MKKELKILVLSSALFVLAGGLFGPIYAIFVEEIGGDILTAGMAYSAFAISAGVLMFLISKWEDRVKHQEKLVFVSFLISSIGFLGYLFIQKPWHLFLVQIIFGIGEAIGDPAYDGVYSRYLDHGKFFSEWGLWESMQLILSAVAAAIGAFLANIYGFKFLFVIMFILSVLGTLVSMLLIIKKARKRKKKFWYKKK